MKNGIASRKELADGLEYAWDNWRDLRRHYTVDRNWSLVCSEFPEVVKAYQDWKTSSAIMDAVVKGINK